MHESKNVAVGILRPPNVAYSKLWRDSDECTNPSDAIYSEQLNERIHDLREMFVEATDAVGVKLAVTEYQLHNDNGHIVPMGKRRARNAVSNDILVTFDPTASQYNFVTRPRPHALQRSLIAFSDMDTLADLTSLLSTASPLSTTE